MTVEYQKVWQTMNDLQMTTSKVCSAREIIDNSIDKIQEHQNDKAEMLMTAAYEFLEYYLQEFDDKFKLAWQATVSDLRDGDKFQYTATGEKFVCDKDDPLPECKGAWESFWESYYPEESQQYTEEELNAMCDAAEQKKDVVTRWILPVQETKDYDTDEIEYFVAFPQDLLDAANLLEGDEIEWIDNKDGSYTIRKSTKPLGPDEC